MVHSFLASPFTDPAQAGQFAAVLAVLQADAATDSLLLGNLVLEDGAVPLDAVVVRPHGITLLVLVPRSGQLSIPALSYGRWQLDGVPLTAGADFDNPFEQLVTQKLVLQAWLQSRFSPEQANLSFISGIVLFGGSLVFAPDVEAAINSTVGTGFQLLSAVVDLTRRLRQLASPEIDLSPADLAEWAAELAAFSAAEQPARPVVPPNPVAAAAGEVAAASISGSALPAAASSPAPAAATGNFLGQKVRAIWRWLGAADVPDDDPAYGYDPAAARREEKQQLEELRQQMQLDLTGQLQALEVREAERERSIAQLRAELAQAPAVASEATALVSRLGTETREKAALEAAMQASRTESAARNQELDAKIQQLSQLIEQLSAQPARVPAQVPGGVPAATPALSPAPGGRPAARPVRPGPQFWIWLLQGWRRRSPRVAAGAAGLALLSLGGWGLSHLSAQSPVPVQENGRWGYADAGGKVVVPAQYSAAGPFQAGRAVVAKDGAYGFVNEQGQETVLPAYDALNPYAGGYARARVGDTYTFIDAKGQEFDHYYFNALDFAEGFAAVLDYRGWFYISGPPEDGTPPVFFAEAYSFSDGLARVKLADGYTFITPAYLKDPTKGSKPFARYQQATDFVAGKAHVTQGGRSFVINRDAEEIKQ